MGPSTGAWHYMGIYMQHLINLMCSFIIRIKSKLLIMAHEALEDQVTTAHLCKLLSPSLTHCYVATNRPSSLLPQDRILHIALLCLQYFFLHP